MSITGVPTLLLSFAKISLESVGSCVAFSPSESNALLVDLWILKFLGKVICVEDFKTLCAPVLRLSIKLFPSNVEKAVDTSCKRNTHFSPVRIKNVGPSSPVKSNQSQFVPTEHCNNSGQKHVLCGRNHQQAQTANEESLTGLPELWNYILKV